MSDYWHRAYICPFWEAAGKKTIKCEDGCMLCFRESCDTAEYISRYCASYVTASGQYSGNLVGNTIQVGTQGILYGSYNSQGNPGMEVYGSNGLRLTSAGNVYLGAQGGGSNGSITIGGVMVSIYAASGLYVN